MQGKHGEKRKTEGEKESGTDYNVSDDNEVCNVNQGSPHHQDALIKVTHVSNIFGKMKVK